MKQIRLKHILILLVFLVIPSLSMAEEEHLPLAAGICVNKAQLLFQNGEIPKAVDVLEKFTAKQAGLDKQQIQKKGYAHYYIYFLLGNYYLTLAQETEGKQNKIFSRNAMTNFQKAVLQNPTFCAAWLNLAKTRYEAGLFAQAAKAFEKGYQTSETQKPVHLYYAAVCNFHANDPATALTVFNRLIKLHPDKVTLAWKETLVHILFALERYRDALPWLEQLASNSKKEKQKKWQEILLHQYMSLNMNKKALEYADFLTRTDTLEPKWWKALSHIHLGNNQFKQGLSALVIYGYLTPMTRKELLLAADLYLSLDVPAKAASFYTAALKEKQDQKNIAKISRAFTMAYDQDKALEWIDKGLSACQDIKLLRIKAQILYNKKEYAKAADAYETLAKKMLEQKTASKNDTPGQVWLMLGYCAMNDHQLTRSQKAFLKASKYKKQQKSAQKAIALIKAMQTKQNCQVM
ncbi:tetratricopeptide repeat protein [Desulfobacula toluolica]|uniref:Tetratricopeptide repeat protein n=1 Tax=Desulfobacula toluolica (strain DSM 7467 / Tol2) TaxID=651182 RepID=K0NRL3_DESTT|nr:tetratricopeptide repeat protein [Desulfobacula toluolica]CCK81587.1 tetratricopeptide repeat protein [Desulfobacula toluolica Tol2]